MRLTIDVFLHSLAFLTLSVVLSAQVLRGAEEHEEDAAGEETEDETDEAADDGVAVLVLGIGAGQPGTEPTDGNAEHEANARNSRLIKIVAQADIGAGDRVSDQVVDLAAGWLGW